MSSTSWSTVLIFSHHGSEKSVILSRFKSKKPSIFCIQLKTRAVPLSFILILPSSVKESFHSVRKYLEMATEVWHYGQWLEQGLKNGRRNFKECKYHPTPPSKALFVVSQPPKRRRSLFRSQQPDRITPALPPPITHVPALMICRELQRHWEDIAKTWGIFSSACQESVIQQRGCQAHVSLTQSDNTSNGGVFNLAERLLLK